jgi:hypothetical protein
MFEFTHLEASRITHQQSLRSLDQHAHLLPGTSLRRDRLTTIGARLRVARHARLPQLAAFRPRANEATALDMLALLRRGPVG